MHAGDQETRFQRVLVVVGIATLAFNLRPAAVSVGPVLDEVRGGLGLNGTETGLLTSLPVLSFAVFGALAPRFARRIGMHRATLVALLALVAGLWLRSRMDAGVPFLLLSFVSLSGMAVANVLLPSLVKLHFPDRVGLLTSVYSTFLALGLTSASILTVPIAEHGSGAGLDWRLGLVVWAGTAVVAVLPWLALVRHDQRQEVQPQRHGLADVARTRIGWVMAVFFGLQSLQAYVIFGWVAKVYRDAGFSASTAGLLLGVATGISIPLSFVIPSLTARLADPRVLLTAIMGCYPVGYLGLLIAPVGGAWVWAVALGIGTTTFPFILTLIGLRARTPAGTAALSGFTQSVGYLISVIGPFGVGVLHDATRGWTVPLWALLAVCVPQYLVGLAASRPAYLEDQLTARPATEKTA
ncbi:CynX/NimT family MFS transporter [Nocardioides pocheonensis]|uniref:CynX/NimT family MFS transporter n=1 Tax=Nocardioides pocheonensis TaxID=661485 RepID=UPI001FE71764|nr:MFS transporter [Nocardioides pocheonensis]